MADDEDDRTRKKKVRRAVEDDEDDRPRRKKKKRRDDDDDSDLGSSPLSALIPIGGSVLALMSLWLSVIGVLLTVASFRFFEKEIWSCVLPALWPLSLLSGGLSFFTHKHKVSYGSIAGNFRAIIGIVISLGVMAAHGYLVYVYLTRR